ncbi:MAG: sulfatase [Candidatus Omnitrophica bacterium]|nr:sulfatase [Candidatus Omnitrophota bacterium]
MTNRLRTLATTYLLPPGWVEAYRQTLMWFQRGRGWRHWPQNWRGGPLPVEGCRHAFHAVGAGQLRCVTVGGETRVALACHSHHSFEAGPFEGVPAYLVLAVAPASGQGTVRNLSVMVNGQRVGELHGTLPAGRWTNLRLASSGPGVLTMSLCYEGGGRVWAASPLAGRPPARPSNNILVLIVDSLTPNDLGCYQDSPAGSLTPHIDRFFRAGTRFTNAFAQGEWTLPSSTSMLTGLYAIQHGNYNPSWYQRSVPRTVPTWPELLQQAGYRTLCYSTATRFQPAYGFHRGFDRFLFTVGDQQPLNHLVTNAGIEFMEAHRDEPWACYLHLFECHPPFGQSSYYADVNTSPFRWASSEEVYLAWKRDRQPRELLKDLDTLKVAKIRQTDLCLGRLFDYLETSGLAEQTTVFLLSDHGDELTKDIPLLTTGRVHIPLLIRGPTTPDRLVADLVEPGVDLYPTIVQLTGLDVPPHAMGQDLLRLREPRQAAVSESLYGGVYEIALRTATWCYVYTCRMDPVSGDVLRQERLGEYLYRRNPETGKEDYAENLASGEPEVVVDFRDRAARIDRAPRYFDARSVIASTMPSRHQNGLGRERGRLLSRAGAPAAGADVRRPAGASGH